MQQHIFSEDVDYVEAQTRLTLSRMKQNKLRFCTTPETLAAIRRYHLKEVRKALCHGVRTGEELVLFENLFKTGSWIGTEITKELCGQKILHRDFTQIDQAWIGSFDLIYSNALDHAQDPWKTLKAWVACLARDGKLYIEWNAWHNKLGHGSNKADCFAADDREYLLLLSEVAHVENVLEVRDLHGKRLLRKIFVVR